MAGSGKSPVEPLPRTDVIGVPITATNMEECVSYIASNLDAIRGGYVCVSNAHACVMAHDDPAYWGVQAGSVMSVPDGKPLSVIGRREFPSMGRVTGPDLMREVLAMSPARGWRHYFYGSTQESLDALRAALERDWPDLSIAGMEPSVFRPLSDDEKRELAGRIDASGADFCWVALGAPRQEVLCHDMEGMTRSLMVGVGGAFNVLSGVVSDAPAWMKDHGLEWLYRLVQEPGRLWRRYLVTNTKFVAYQLTGARRKGR